MIKRITFLLGLLILLLAACNGNDDNNGNNSENGTDDPPDIAVLVERAAQQLDEAQSFQLVLEANGTPIYLDPEAIGFPLPIQFRRAEGVFVAPDMLGGSVNLQIQDAVAEASLIVVGQDQYVNHVLITLNNWQLLTFSQDFNPGTLTQGEQSIPAALRTLQGAEYLGEVELDGVSMHHIRGEIEASRVSAVTVGLIGATEGFIEAELYIRSNDERLERLDLSEPRPDIGADEPTLWRIELYDYNGDYSVERPKLGGN